MALPTNYSLIFSVGLCVLTFAAMQAFKDNLSTDGLMTIVGGFIGSWIFIFLVTIAGNLGSILIGESYYVKVFPEVIACLVITMGVAASIHRVCATTSLIFSLVALYFMNRISQSERVSSSVPPSHKTTHKSTAKASGKSKNK